MFAYVSDIFAAFPFPIMEAAFGRLHNAGPAAFGRRPTVVELIIGDGKAATMSKTQANTCKICACFAHIVYFMIFSLLGPFSYSIREIRSPDPLHPLPPADTRPLFQN